MSDSSIQPESLCSTEPTCSLSSVNEETSQTTNSNESQPPQLDLMDLGDMPLLSLLEAKLDRLSNPETALKFVQELRSLRTNPAAMKALRVKEGTALAGKRKATPSVVSQAKIAQANDDLFSKLGLDL
jgi:hypothetical protein